MNFKTNFNKLTLLGNIPNKIYFEDKTVEFVPPNLQLYLMDLDFIEILSLLKQSPEEFNKNIEVTKMVIETRYGILRFLLYSKFRTKDVEQFISSVFPNLKIIDDLLYCDDKKITEKEYNILLDFILVSCAEKGYDELIKELEVEAEIKSERELTPAEKKMKELQDKVDKAKKKNKSKEPSSKSEESSITIDQIIIAILYEFPNLSIKDIYSMNMFSLLQFWTYVGKVVDTQIQIVAAGNGNLKKFTYFIN